jgi:hypothetical protein
MMVVSPELGDQREFKRAGAERRAPSARAC